VTTRQGPQEGLAVRRQLEGHGTNRAVPQVPLWRSHLGYERYLLCQERFRFQRGPGRAAAGWRRTRPGSASGKRFAGSATAGQLFLPTLWREPGEREKPPWRPKERALDMDRSAKQASPRESRAAFSGFLALFFLRLVFFLFCLYF